MSAQETLNNRNAFLVAVTADFINNGLRNWYDTDNDDPTTKALLETIEQSGEAQMVMRGQLGNCEVRDLVAHVRRGWAYAKMIYGPGAACDLLYASGSIIAMSAALLLNSLENNVDVNDPENLEKIAMAPTLGVWIVGTAAQHTGSKGSDYVKQVGAVIPMTDVERKNFKEQCESIDFTVERKYIN